MSIRDEVEADIRKNAKGVDLSTLDLILEIHAKTKTIKDTLFFKLVRYIVSKYRKSKTYCVAYTTQYGQPAILIYKVRRKKK